jgi:small subunit ribosomal protein S10
MPKTTKKPVAKKPKQALKKTMSKTAVASKKSAAHKAIRAPQARAGTSKAKATSSPKPPKSAQQEEKAKTRIRIKIAAYDNKVIDKSTKTIIDTARRSRAEVVGPIPLPTNIKKFTLLRSTFVHKDARDQYEIRTHKRLIDIYEPTAKTMDDLQNLSLPAGVGIEIKM